VRRVLRGVSQVLYISSKNSSDSRVDDIGKMMVRHKALEEEEEEVRRIPTLSG
jgi:hypothetical protein